MEWRVMGMGKESGKYGPQLLIISFATFLNFHPVVVRALLILSQLKVFKTYKTKKYGALGSYLPSQETRGLGRAFEIDWRKRENSQMLKKRFTHFKMFTFDENLCVSENMWNFNIENWIAHTFRTQDSNDGVNTSTKMVTYWKKWINTNIKDDYLVMTFPSVIPSHYPSPCLHSIHMSDYVINTSTVQRTPHALLIMLNKVLMYSFSFSLLHTNTTPISIWMVTAEHGVIFSFSL